MNNLLSNFPPEPKPDHYLGMTQQELQKRLDSVRFQMRKLGKQITSIRRKLEPFEKLHGELMGRKWELERKLAPVLVVTKKPKVSKASFLSNLTPEDLAAWKDFRAKSSNNERKEANDGTY